MGVSGLVCVCVCVGEKVTFGTDFFLPFGLLRSAIASCAMGGVESSTSVIMTSPSDPDFNAVSLSFQPVVEHLEDISAEI